MRPVPAVPILLPARRAQPRLDLCSINVPDTRTGGNVGWLAYKGILSVNARSVAW